MNQTKFQHCSCDEKYQWQQKAVQMAVNNKTSVITALLIPVGEINGFGAKVDDLLKHYNGGARNTQQKKHRCKWPVEAKVHSFPPIDALNDCN
jgi:hypothetical protein